MLLKGQAEEGLKIISWFHSKRVIRIEAQLGFWKWIEGEKVSIIKCKLLFYYY